MSFITAGLIIGGATLVGGAVSAIGAKSAADAQARGARNAQNLQMEEFNQIKGMENPYLQSGYSALGQLNYLQGIGTPGQYQTASSAPEGGFGSLNQPFTAQYMKQYSPAYQFQLQQGQQGVLNQDAGSQGALSGAALKDLTSFNQSYANTAFNSAFNQYQTQNQNTYDRLANIANLGQSAASQTAQSGTTLSGGISQSAQNIGTAQAAGTVGAANALSGGISNAGLLAGLYGGYGGQAGGFNVDNTPTLSQSPWNTPAMGTIPG